MLETVAHPIDKSAQIGLRDGIAHHDGASHRVGDQIVEARLLALAQHIGTPLIHTRRDDPGGLSMKEGCRRPAAGAWRR